VEVVGMIKRFTVARSYAWLLLLPIGLPLPPDQWALWFDLGHRMVARIAEQRLMPRTAEAVLDILDGQSLADASVWADNIKQYRHDADALHYVDIPLTAGAYDSARDCPHGKCIIAAIASDQGGNVYVNFGADYPRQTFTAVALAPLGSWTARLDSLAGKRVRVRGEIVKYRGRVEIVLNEPGQISAERGTP
jgi:hypothetical protein